MEQLKIIFEKLAALDNELKEIRSELSEHQIKSSRRKNGELTLKELIYQSDDINARLSGILFRLSIKYPKLISKDLEKQVFLKERNAGKKTWDLFLKSTGRKF